MFTFIESFGDTAVQLQGRTFPTPSLIEDEDGIRLLLIGEDISIPAWIWTAAHAGGAAGLLMAGGDGLWSWMLAETFIEGRTEHHPSASYLAPQAWSGLDPEPMTYRQMLTFNRVAEVDEEIRQSGFVHLHAHSEFSPLDGMSTVTEMVREAVADDQRAVAVTDHSVCASHPHLQAACDKAGIKAIFGIEANFTDDRFKRGEETEVDGKKVSTAQEVLGDYTHLVMWAMDDAGLRNLWAMSTEANRTGFYGRPRLDWDVLSTYSEGVMASTACLRGPLSKALLAGDEMTARSILARLMEIFPDRLYVEIHTNHLDEQIRLNHALIALAREYGLPIIAAVDAHYPCREDADTHRAWIAAQTNKDVQDDADLFAGGQQYHMMTEAEVREALAYLGPQIVDEAVENTGRVADRCTAKLSGKTVTPIFSKVGGAQRDVERLVEMCIGNWRKKVVGKAKSEDEYEARFEREMRLLIDKGFCFVAGTSITLADGSLRPVEQVVVGDEVVTRTGVGRVARTLVRTPDRTVKIDVVGSAWPLHTTPDHPLWVRGKDWAQAGEVQVGDYLAVGLAEAHQQTEFDLLGLAIQQGWRVEREGGRFRRLGAGRWDTDRAKTGWCPERIGLDADWGYLLGLWLAEGHREVQGSNAGQVAWTLCVGEPAIERLTSTLVRLGLGEARIYSKASASQTDHRGVTIKVTNHPLWLLLGELLGDGVRGKRLHPWLATAPADTTYSLVEGWFDGDGTTKASGRKVLDMVSPGLARQARQMLLRQGVWATTTRFTRRADGVESYRVCWQTKRTKKPYGALWADGRWWVRVISTTDAPAQEVYNLTIDGDPSYVAEDVVTHNCGYFLMVADYCRWSRAHGIMVGPGRGSGGGSLVAYLADIVEIDPVDADLLFERFLTEGRTELPDFDVDFPTSKRAALQAYLVERYGAEYMVRVGTHVRLKNKGVVRNLASVLKTTVDIHWPDIDVVSKIIEAAEADKAGAGMPWEDLWAEHGELLMPFREKYPLLFSLADKMVGRLKSYGKHAAGMVIATDEPLTGRLPMRLADDVMVAEFDMKALEMLGLVKFDLLTLRTIDTIQMAVDLIREQRDIEINVYDWVEEYKDPQVWDEIGDGHTLGIFQIETRSGTRLAKRFRPQSTHELADVITLVRPGPVRSGLTETFFRRRAGDEPVSFPDPRLAEVLSKTYGCFAAETRVVTKQGVREIADLAGAKHNLMTTKGGWMESEVRSFGVQPLRRLTLQRNKQTKVIYATPEHRWFSCWSDSKSKFKEVLTDALQPGMVLQSQMPYRSGRTLPSPFGIAAGVTFGDGTRTQWVAHVDLHGEKNAELLRYFSQSRVVAPGDQNRYSEGYVRVLDLPRGWKDHPSLEDGPAYLMGWLAGYFAADGCVSAAGKPVMCSARKGDLEFFRTAAHLAGIGTYSITSKIEEVMLPGERPFKREMHTMGLVRSTLTPEFFVLSAHRSRFEAGMAARQKADRVQWTVVSVEETDRVEEVYCAVVPHTQAFVLEDNILTGNCLLYQEDLMQTCMVLAGYDGIEADKVRSILGKKKVEEIPAAGRKFVRQSIERGMGEVDAERLWDQMAEFAKYSFNRAHAFGYAVLGYWTAWLKFHYPAQMLTALLSTVDQDRIPEFVNEARRMGYKVLPPDVNKSGVGFSAHGTEVRYGLDKIKGLGEKAVQAITPGQPYTSFDDFMARKGSAADAGIVKLLVKVGAFDALEPNRRALERRVEFNTSGEANRCQHKDESKVPLPCGFDWLSEPNPPMVKVKGEMVRKPPPKRCTKACRMFTAPVLTVASLLPYNDKEIRDREMEMLGIHLSSTPFDVIEEEALEAEDILRADDIDLAPPGDYLAYAIVTKIRAHVARNGKEMAFLGLYAQNGDLDVTVFSDTWTRYQADLKVNTLCVVEVSKNDRGLTLSRYMPVLVSQ